MLDRYGIYMLGSLTLCSSRLKREYTFLLYHDDGANPDVLPRITSGKIPPTMTQVKGAHVNE
jgi:hypothetical protein